MTDEVLVEHDDGMAIVTINRPEQRKRQESGRSDTVQSTRTVQIISSVQSWTLDEEIRKYPITQFIAHQSFMACKPHKTSIV